MNEFLAAFSASLKHMRADKKEEILKDFREHFEIGIESGKSEQEIASELGGPRLLALWKLTIVRLPLAAQKMMRMRKSSPEGSI